LLVLSRKNNESIVIGDDVFIIVVEIRRDKVRLETTKILTVSHTPTGKPLRRRPLRTRHHNGLDVR